MNISEKIKEDLNPTQFNDLVKKAQVHVNWLGSRQVTVEGFEGSLYMSDLMNTFFEFVDRRTVPDDRPFPDFSLEDRLSAIHCIDNLENLFEKGDEAIKQSSLLTRILAIVQKTLGLFSYCGTEGFYLVFDPRFDLVWSADSFLNFTKAQFEKTFPGKTFPQSDSFISLEEQNKGLDDGYRYSVSKSWIRKNMPSDIDESQMTKVI